MPQGGSPRGRARRAPPAATALELRGPQVACRLADIERATPTQNHIVRRAQAGDPVAQRQLYDDHFPHVYAYLLEALKHHHDAEDACQHVFLKVFATLATYRPAGEPFRNWLFTLVRNHAIDRLRAAIRTKAIATDPHELNSIRESAGARHELRDDKPKLEAAVRALPRLQRQVLSLMYVHDLPATQAAAILGRTPSAIRQVHHRALTTLAGTI